MRVVPKVVLLLSLSGACASQSAKPVASPSAAPTAEPGTPEAGATAAPGSPAPDADGDAPEAEPPSGASLPEVKIENVGLHIGGGSNDPASKEPFQRALAARFDDLRACYRLIEEPKSGTFGVDLHIPRGGGRPRVEQPRTALRGDAFRACVIRAFEATEFEKTKLPIVISYSVRFSIGQ